MPPFYVYDTSGGLIFSAVYSNGGLIVAGHARLIDDHLSRFLDWLTAVRAVREVA